MQHNTSFNRDTLHTAMRNKACSIRYYRTLAGLTAEEDEINALEQIHADEEKHLHALERLWMRLYRSKPQYDNDCILPENYRAGLRKAIINEIDAARVYRDMYLDVGDTEMRNTLFEMATDESDHAQRLQWCLSKEYGID